MLHNLTQSQKNSIHLQLSEIESSISTLKRIEFRLNNLEFLGSYKQLLAMVSDGVEGIRSNLDELENETFKKFN